MDPKRTTLWRLLALGSGVLARIFKAEEENGAGTGETKKQHVLLGTTDSLNQLELAQGVDAGTIDQVLDTMGDLIDVLVRLFNLFGIFQRNGQSPPA